MRAAIGTLLGGFLALTLLAPAPAFAQEMIDAKAPERVAEILKGFGIARVGASSNGDPQISGRTKGKTYEVFFFGCEDNKDCRNIQFWAYWDQPASLEVINNWNKQTRFGRTYLDDDNDLVLEFAVNLSHGIDDRTLEDNADVWMRMLEGVEEDILGK